MSENFEPGVSQVALPLPCNDASALKSGDDVRQRNAEKEPFITYHTIGICLELELDPHAERGSDAGIRNKHNRQSPLGCTDQEVSGRQVLASQQQSREALSEDDYI